MKVLAEHAGLRVSDHVERPGHGKSRRRPAAGQGFQQIRAEDVGAAGEAEFTGRQTNGHFSTCRGLCGVARFLRAHVIARF